MHPLPRRDEINADMDDDPRSIYFKQAARGVPIRMAILARLLGSLPGTPPATEGATPRYPVTIGQNPCVNPTCISRTEARHVVPMLEVSSLSPLRAQCGYCWHRISFEL